MALSDQFDFVALGFGRQSDGGNQFLLPASNLLLFNFDLLPAFDDRNLHLLGPDLLTRLGRLQLVRKLSFRFLFDDEREFLQKRLEFGLADAMTSHPRLAIAQTYGSVNLAVKVGFLKLVKTRVVLHFRVHVVLDVH